MSNTQQTQQDKPIFCYECRTSNSWVRNPLWDNNYEVEWVCRVCGHKTWRPINQPTIKNPEKP